ncbi:Xanthine permease [Serinicoccus hydrothermalis]|uniref:Xanthine permease n=1 Tax=Serinicoccus hydrothermalis TaxID=1758689 RepID=A0A1B1NGM7_9MICO|nr:Xanthine permease [Serinicoccus hydrothermalis]
MAAGNVGTVRPEDERLGIGASVAYGLQHVLTMYGGIIAVPLIMGGAAGLDAAQTGLLIASCLFVSGLSTILQSVGVPFFGSQLPLVQGVSFASVATMLTILEGGNGLPGVFGAVIAAGALGLIIAPFFARIAHFFPPVVTGVVITTIGLTLLPVAGRWAMGNAVDSPDYGSVANLSLAGFTLLVIVALSKVGLASLSRLSILLAIVLGTVVAALFGMADFSRIGEGSIFAVPQPFVFGAPVFDIAAILSMFIVIIVIMTETMADIIAVGEIVRTKVDSRRIANGLRADMLSTMARRSSTPSPSPPSRRTSGSSR